MKIKNVFRFTICARLATALSLAVMTASPLFIRAQDPGYYNSQQSDQADPPSIVGRLSVLQGNVSLQSAGVQDFSAAELNYPLTTGDRLYTDNGARGEVQAGQLSIRLGAQTDFTVTALSDSLAQFGLAQGSVHLRSFSFDPNSATEVDTPNATVSLMSQGDVRVDVYPQDNVTVVTVLQGQAHVDADGVQQTLQQGQSIQISGANPSRAQFVGRQRPDDLDRFSAQRDAMYQQAFASEGSYVNPATIGADDLAGYGDWDNSADYGAVWYPRNVAADWAPYSNGHWANISPWGWTWVGAEPWGFAPYHYGRWARFGNRWGWVPGPQVVRPVYSPALVVFVGAPTFARGGFSITLGGGGVAAWFPLGPREAYHPWYRSSDRYVNRVNVTNIYNRNPVEVRNVYNNRTNVYANAPSSYANRGVATIAVSQRDFGSGRPVRESAVRVDPRQFQNAPVLNRAPVEAQQQTGSRPPARAVPPRTERPVLETRGNGNPNAPRGPRDGNNNGGAFGGRPGQQQQNPVAGQPNRGNNGQPVPSTQPAPDSGNNGGRGNDGRFNNGRGAQPGQAAPIQQNPAPSGAGQASPIVNGGRGQDGRFNNGQPAQQPSQAAPAQAPPQATHTPPTSVQMQNDGSGNNGRFNNGRNPGQPAQTPPVTTQSAPQTPTVVPANPNDSARPGPRRQAPDAPVRVEPQPQQQDQQRQQQLELQRQQQLQQQQTQQQNQQRQQQQEQQRQQQVQQQQLEQQHQQQLQQQQTQQQNQQRQQLQEQQQQQVEQQRQQQLQQQQTQQQNQQRQQQLEQQRQQQQTQQQEQQRQQREAQQPATPRPAPPAQQPAPQQPRPQQQAAPEKHQPPPARPVTPPDDKKKE